MQKDAGWDLGSAGCPHPCLQSRAQPSAPARPSLFPCITLVLLCWARQHRQRWLALSILHPPAPHPPAPHPLALQAKVTRHTSEKQRSPRVRPSEMAGTTTSDAPSQYFTFSSQGGLSWKVSVREDILNKAGQPEDSYHKCFSLRGPSAPGLQNRKGLLQEL